MEALFLTTVGAGIFLGVILGNLLLAGLSTVAAIIYLSRLAVESWRGRENLAAARSAPNAIRIRHVEKGNESEALVEALRYRANISENAGTSNAVKRLMVQRGTQAPKNSIAGIGPLFEQDPRLASFRCAALILCRLERDEKGNQTIVFDGRGKGNSRFESALAAFAAPFLLRGGNIFFGLRDERVSGALFSGFYRFGFNFTAAFPVLGFWEGVQVKRLLWAGFTEDRTPSDRELEMLAEFAREIGSEISQAEALRVLSERVVRAEQGEKQKADFAAQLSHDMRSPLHNIKAVLNLLEVENREGEKKQLLDVARKNCTNLGELVEDVLDLTRHGAGKLSAVPEVFDLAVLVREMTENYKISIEHKGIRLALSLPSEPLLVEADLKHFRRIFSNLLSNAIKYTSFGEISISATEIRGKVWRVLVKDSGCGISAQNLGRLFTPFSRFHDDGIEGMGLGLAISKILCDLNSTHISVRSEQGRGSEFELLIPQSERKNMICRSEGEEGFGSPDLRGVSALVVDDDIGCVDSLVRILERNGCRTLKAYSVQDAISILNFDCPSCILADSQMPDGGAAKILRTIREKGLPIRAVVISGDAAQHKINQFLSAGAERVLLKPLAMKVLSDWLVTVREQASRETASAAGI